MSATEAVSPVSSLDASTDELATLAALRQQFDGLAQTVASVATDRAAKAAATAESALESVESSIKSAPVTALVLAVAAGAVLAVAVTSRRRDGTSYERLARYVPSQVRAFDSEAYAHRAAQMADVARQALPSSTGIMTYVERLANSLSNSDGARTVEGVVRQASEWARGLIGGVRH